MLKFLVIIMLTFTAIEAAHLNYHVQSERKANEVSGIELQQDVNRSNFDKNF